MVMKKVFLSSTSKDLAEYRDAAYKAIEGLDGYHCVRMEDFSAADNGAYNHCRIKISECQLFVGIIGHLYGSSPEGCAESFTELEYNAAIDADISRLMFLAPEEFPIPANFREDQEKWEKQKAFRKRVSRDRILSKFDSPENLAAEIAIAIHNWQKEQRHTKVPFQAPPLLEHFVPRPEESSELKNRLLDLDQMSTGILVISAIKGLGGIGKTILATVMAHDSDVKKRFVDGILWATLGQEPDILSLLSGWIQGLGDYEFHPTTPKAATDHLRTMLQDKSLLAIIDDAWRVSDVKPFLVGGLSCQILITTRDSLIANAFGARLFELDVMTESQSLKLLSNRLNREIEGYEVNLAMDLAKTVGYLPLALELAASQVIDGVLWTHLIKDLRDEVAKLEALEMPGVEEIDEPTRRYLSLKACFKLSLQLLPGNLKTYFAWLGVFPEDVLLNSKMVSTLWSIDEQKAGRDLRYLRSKSLLLSGPQLSDEMPTYRLHDLVHDLARNQLTNPIEPLQRGDLPGLGLRIQDAHSVLLDLYLRKAETNQWHTIPDDNYIHAHILWHMEKAKRFEDIHNLLREETAESRNAWYEIRDHQGQTGGFIEDIARAWRLSEVIYEAESEISARSRVISLQIRYALISASINSLASNVPPSLLTGMVKTNIWTPAQGLAYARLVPELKHRDETLRRLHLCLSKPQDALMAVREITDEYLKSNSLLNIVEKVPEPQKTEILRESLSVADRIKDPNLRADMFAKIALILPNATEALELARKIQKEDIKAQTFCEIALKLSEPEKTDTLKLAISLAKNIKIRDQRDKTLAKIAPFATIMGEAVEITKEIYDVDRRIEVLARISPSLKGEELTKALQIARDVGSNYNIEKTDLLMNSWTRARIEKSNKKAEALAKDQMSKALARIALNLQDPQDALLVASEIEDKSRKDEALARIALNMSKQFLTEALSVSKMISDSCHRSETIAEILLNMPNAQNALELAKEIKENDMYADALVGISLRLPEAKKTEILNEALNTLNKIEDMTKKTKAFAHILPKLPDSYKPNALHKTLDSTKKIVNESTKADILSMIGNLLPENLINDALLLINGFWDDDLKSIALLNIAPFLTKFTREYALSIANSIKDSRKKAETSLSIAPILLNPQEMVEILRSIKDDRWIDATLGEDKTGIKNILKDTFKIARMVKDEYSRSKTLIKIMQTMSEPQDMRKIVENIYDKQLRAEALISILPSFSEYQKINMIEEAIGIIAEISDEKIKIDNLLKIIPLVPKTFSEDLLKIARNITIDDRRSEVLSTIITHLLDSNDMIKTSREIKDESWKAKTLIIIAPNVEDSKELLKLASEIKDEHWKAESLAGISSNLPYPLLINALQVANSIGYFHWKLRALTGIACSLPEQEKVAVIKKAHNTARKIRDIYWKSKALSWVASSLTNPNDALEIAYEIKDVYWRSETLARVAHDLHEPEKNAIFKEAFRESLKIKDFSRKARLIAKISQNLPVPMKADALNTAIDSITKIENERTRVKTLLEISDGLPESLLTNAIGISEDIFDIRLRIESFVGISFRLPEPKRYWALKHAFDEAKKIGDLNLRSEMLAEIVCPLSSLPADKMYPIWQEAHHVLARRTRKDLLADLSALIPMILVIGGPDATREGLRAIEDVSRWWP